MKIKEEITNKKILTERTKKNREDNDKIINALKKDKSDLVNKISEQENIIRSFEFYKQEQQQKIEILQIKIRRVESQNIEHFDDNENHEMKGESLLSEKYESENKEIEKLNSLVFNYKTELDKNCSELNQLKKYVTEMNENSYDNNTIYEDEIESFKSQTDNLIDQIQSHENKFEKQTEINGIIEKEKLILQKENDILEKEKKFLEEKNKFYEHEIEKFKKLSKHNMRKSSSFSHIKKIMKTNIKKRKKKNNEIDKLKEENERMKLQIENLNEKIIIKDEATPPKEKNIFEGCCIVM